MEQYLTPEETAALLRVSLASVYRWLRSGRLSAGRAGSRWLITQQNIDAFLAAPRRKSRAAAGSAGVEVGSGSASSSTPAHHESARVVGGLAVPTTDAFLEGRPGASALAGMKRNQKRKK
jgi:excisionase family DNA binding protein